MKTFTKQIAGVLFATLALCSQVFAQQSLFGIRLQDANSHVLTIGSPTTGFTGSYNFRFPAAVPAAGGLLYASDGIGQSSWLPAGTTGQVLSFSAGGLPVWSNLSSLLTGLIEWDISGNSLVAAYNGIIGSYLGTSNNQPLVLATTNILTPEPIEFFTNNTEKMRLTSGGELGIGLTPAAGKLLHVAGTSGTSNVRLASLASATGTTGRLMFATDATGDLQDLAFPASSGQVLSSTTGGVLSWTTPTSGTVTSVSVTTANGVSGVVANPTTTPAITLTLGAITPSSVASTGAVSGTNLSGTNTGDVTLAGTGTYLSLAGQVLTQNPIDLSTANASGVLAAGRFPALTGDVTTVAGALASTIQPAAVTLAKMANLAANSIIGNNTGVGATPIALTTAQVKTMLNLTGTNSGDVSLGGENYLSIAGQVITANAVNLSGTNVTSILPETKGGTNQSTYTLGDMLYSSAANTLSKLAGNTVATKKFLTQTGTGAVSAAPAWNAIAAADVPVMVASGASHAPGIVPDPGAVAGATKFLREDATWGVPVGSGGTVTSVSVTTANGVSGVVANPTTTPAITLTLGAITPSSVASTGAVSGTNLSGTNTGDVTLAGQNYLSIAGQVITANAVNLSGTNVTSILPETKGGTNQSTYTLGDMLYSSAANTLSKLAGNTVATKKFLTQTGTGAVSAAPAWNAIAAADVPVMVASGASHAPGIVPDPGAVAGATKYLREDGTWVNPGASTGWALGGNNLPASNIFGTTSATNVMMQANSTQTLQLTGVATANYDVGSVLLGTTATPIVSTGDKLVINGGNFSLNSETNGAITREIVFRGTAGSGNLRIRGDGNDLYWQGGGGKNLQMGAYWQINLLGQLQTAALQPLSANSTFAHVYIPLSQTADAGLVIQNASGQTADPFQIQAFNATQGSGSILAKVTSGGNMLLGASGAQLQLQGTGTGISTFQSGAQGATNFNYTLPTTIPTVNQVLTATAVAAPNVTLGWTSAGGGSVAGANTQVQYNNSGAFGASANFTYDGTTLQSTTSSTTDAIAAIKGSVTGNGGANGELNGVWGIASSATQGANTNAGTGVRAEGNNTTTDANSNIALHVINGEFVVGRQASSAASDNSNGNNILVANEDDIDGLTDQGPSGIVDVTDGGNPVAGGPTTNSLQVFNRYAKAHSIILITPMTGGTGAEGVNETATFQISGRANGSFNIDVRRVHPNGAAGTSGTWRVGFLIINPGK